MRFSLLSLAGLVCFAACASAQSFTQGTLRLAGSQEECPLRHTSVKADIAGMVARVNVTQEFHNDSATKVEAVYTFPLPHDAAVDRMTMTIGSRVIEGKVHKKEEAQALYNAAREQGRTAALLDQHRPNIFTQSLANLEPGADVRIDISYVETLRYEAGKFEFVFPMVVAPRYKPGAPSPPLTPEGTRAGHDISVEVALDAGLPIGNVASPTHEIDLQWVTSSRALVRLKDQQSIPNRDFLLRYESASGAIQDTVLAHYTAQGGYFALMLEPPRTTGAADASPKELIFVLDTSGSMMGFPIEKAKEAMIMALSGLYSNDTFNLITFSGDTEILFPEPVAATPENIEMAKLFLQSRSGSGGTEMMKAIRAALDPSAATGRVRVVCFMTDGEVGNDMEILSEVQKHTAARVFAFGIGQSVNRFLLDGMAHLGRGEVEYVGLQDDGSAAARRFWQRVRDPLLTDLEIDFGGLPVTDVYPKRIPDLFGAKPVLITGRYRGPLRGTVQLRGKAGGLAVNRTIALDLPADARHDSLASLWARQRVSDLMTQDYAGYHAGAMKPELREQIVQTGLAYGLSTQFTSFLAVEERTVTVGGKARRVEVPVNIPEGMSYRGLPQPGAGVVGGVPGGVAGGVLGGIIGSVPSAALVAPPPPPPPPALAPARQFQTSALIAARQIPPDAPAHGKIDPALAGAAGVVRVRILLRDASPATLDRLRAIGVEVLTAPGKDLQLTGRIAAEKLTDLARLDAVRYVVKAR
jgi:Ca-activated chloride channel family protein